MYEGIFPTDLAFHFHVSRWDPDSAIQSKCSFSVIIIILLHKQNAHLILNNIYSYKYVGDTNAKS